MKDLIPEKTKKRRKPKLKKLTEEAIDNIKKSVKND